MTLKQKSDALEKWCNGNNMPCDECPLHERGDCFAYGDAKSNQTLEENYELVFGGCNIPVGEIVQNNAVDHPAHYQGKNECIDVMVAMFGLEAVKTFCRLNAYKYRFRSARKNGEEDIKKAEWYETWLIEHGGVDES